MKQIIIFVVLLSFILPTSLSAADKKSVTNELVKHLHLAEQAQQISAFALSEIDNRKEGLPEDEYTRLRNIMLESFNQQRLFNIMRDYFMSHYDEKLSPLWLETLKSAEVKKFSALEAKAATPESFQQLMDYSQLLQNNPLPQARIELAQKLNQLSHDSNLAIESQVAVAKVILHAINPTLPSNKQMGTSQIQTALDALRMQISQTLHNFTTVSYLFAYRDVSTDELSHYVGLYETPQGQWATTTLYNAVIKALENAVRQFENNASSSQ